MCGGKKSLDFVTTSKSTKNPQCVHIFVGIYCQKYSTEAPALMKHGEVVQDLAASGHNWNFYNENFLFLRQSQSASFQWGVTH